MPFKFTLGQTVEEWLWDIDGTSITDADSSITYHYSVIHLTGKTQLRIDALNEYVLFEIPDSLLSHVIKGDGSDAKLLHGVFFSLGGDT